MGGQPGPSTGARKQDAGRSGRETRLFVIKQARARKEVSAAGVGMPAFLCAELSRDAGLGAVKVSFTFVQRLLKRLGYSYRTATAAIDKKRNETDILNEQLRLKLELFYIQVEKETSALIALGTWTRRH